jgi:hypothetical protein
VLELTGAQVRRYNMLFDILFNIIDFTKGAFWMALPIGFIPLPFYLIIIIESF